MDLPQLSVDTSPKEYRLCFGCGKDNPAGLKLKFSWDGKEARAEFTPLETHQGWPGYVHGGILLCALDEAFGYATMHSGSWGVTAKMEARLKHMAKIGEPLVITSHAVKNSKRLLETEAKICLKDGTIIAEGASTQYLFSQREEKPETDAK